MNLDLSRPVKADIVVRLEAVSKALIKALAKRTVAKSISGSRWKVLGASVKFLPVEK